MGASAGEVAVSDSTTVNIYKLAERAGRRGRRYILAARDEFPTDRYVLEGLAERRGMELRWMAAIRSRGARSTMWLDALDHDVASGRALAR